MVKKICNVLSTVVLIVLAVGAAVILVPMLLGYKELAVLSGSMEPSIPVGSLVYVKPVQASELQPNDVCTYRLKDGSTFVTHRVIRMDTQAKTIVTKGDANETDDGEVMFDQVYGKAEFHLPLVGHLIVNIKTPVGIMAVCGVLAVVILLNFIPAIIDAGEKEKQKETACNP